MKLYKSNVRLNIQKNFSSQRIIDTWNDLPQHVVDAPSINSFKNRLDKLWNDMGIARDGISSRQQQTACCSLIVGLRMKEN